MQELVSSETLNNEEEIIVFEENLKGPKGDKGDKGDDGYTPKKGVDYFTENDKQELIEAVTEDASSEFVQIVNSKTTEFNNNATSKTDSFNSNATSKETSYNENATAKLNEYNENHTSKMTAYNENSAEKLAVFNENAAEKITEYDNHIEELDNIVSKKTASGESIYIDDALKYKIFDCKIDGNAKQTTTTGKNLLNIPDQVITNSGCTFTFEKGVCTITGTATADDVYCVIGNLNIALKAGTYTYSSGIIRGYPYFSLYYNNSWHQISVYNDNGTKTFEIDEDVIVTQVRFYFSENSIPNIPKLTPQIEQGSVATDYEPYTGGEASPNPDYPQEISIVSDEVKIVQTGKNLFDKNGDFTYGNNNNLTSLQEDGTIKTTANFSNQRSSGQLISVDKNKNYIVSGILVESQSPNNSVIEILNENNTRIYMFEISNSANYKFSFMFNSADNEKIWISLNARDFNLSASVYAIFDKIQIEEGTVSTDYEEYQSNEHTINLQGNELVKLADDIKDAIEIDKQGNVSLLKNTTKKIFDGTESWVVYEDYEHTFRLSNEYIVGGICDYFSPILSSEFDEKAGIYLTKTVSIIISMPECDSLEEFKQWLSEHNVTIYYQPQNSQTINLGQLTNFKTYAGINHFFLEANIATNFEIRYAQDLQKVIAKQQSEIDEIKAILSSAATSALLLDNYESDLINEIESGVEQ